jgi:hypothetical protein
MSKNFVYSRLRGCALAALLIVSSQVLGQELSSAFQDALDKVNAQAPKHFDPVVTPLPDSQDFDKIPTIELLHKLESWNPSLREAAAQTLGSRSDEALPVLLRASEAGNGFVRAGAASALAVIIKRKLSNWKDAYPEMNNARRAQQKILKDNAKLEDTFIRLSRDPELQVRVSALEGLRTMAPQTPEAARAVLELCGDENEHLAQVAMIVLDKRFSVDALQEETVVASLKKAMRTPLPRGRGHVVRIIQRMDERTQRKFIPELLAHLDWQPRRDTMFGAGGQAGAIRLLTDLGVKELIGRLPDLMFKDMRGSGLFIPCLESARAFGGDAKQILPDLRAILAKQNEDGAGRMRDHDKRLQELRQTIDYLENA